MARSAGFFRTQAQEAGRLLGIVPSGVKERSPPKGLNTYHVERHGGISIIHLRVNEDGAGTIFVNVTDALHLSPTAADMAWLSLEKFSTRDALQWLRGRYSRVTKTTLLSDYREMQGLIEKISDPRPACRTCLLDLPKTPLFSTPVSAPYKVDLALTYACNNSCPHCYNETGRFGVPVLSTENWLAIVDVLADKGVPHLIFTGGEPTLHPGLADIIAHAERAGIITGINTNARLLGSGQLLDGLVRAGLDHIQVTIQSHDERVHNSMSGATAFSETLEGLKAALSTNLHVITNTTLTNINAPQTEETLRFFKSLNLKRFAMNALIQSGGGRSNPDALSKEHLAARLVQIRELAKRLGMEFLWYTVTKYCELSPLELEIGLKRCNAGQYSMCIEPNGDVLPCQSYYESAGNILRDSWDVFWHSSLFKSFRERECSTPSVLEETCLNCPDLSVCGGGCRLDSSSPSDTDKALRQEALMPGCRGCGKRI